MIASFVLALIAAPAASPATVSAPPPEPSRIVAATVYPDRVEVTREVSLTGFSGSRQALIGPLPLQIDDSSLRLSGKSSGAGSTALLGDVEVRRVDEVKVGDPELPIAEAALEQLRLAASELDDRMRRAQKLRALLDTLQAASAAQLSREMAATELRPAGWQGAYDFLRQNLDELDAEERATRRAREALARDIQVGSERVAALSGRRSLAHKVLAVSLEGDAPAGLTLTLSYAQPGASWAPTYEAVMDPDSGNVALKMFAWVRQATGEDWSGIRLTLATGAPALGIDLPRLASLGVGPIPPQRHDQKLRTELVDGLPVIGQSFQDLTRLSAGGTDRQDGGNLNAEILELTEVITSGASAQFGRGVGGFSSVIDATAPSPPAAAGATNVDNRLASLSTTDSVMTFSVPGAVTLGSDGQARRMNVSRMELAGRREHLVIPSVRADAFLLARLTAPADRPLLAGSVKHYIGSTLVGTSTLAGVAPAEEFVLSFGIDDRVKVERPALPAVTSRKGDDTLIAHDRRVTVTNRTGRPIDLKVKERVPVPTDTQVRVSLGPQTTPGSSTTESEPGIHTWSLALAAGEKKEIGLAYTIRHPARMALAAMR